MSPIALKCTGADGQVGMLEVVWSDETDEAGLGTASNEEPEFVEIDLTWDTGAGDSVLDKVDASGHEIQESRGYRVGACFVAADGNRIDNEGQLTLEMKPRESEAEINSRFQVAKVTRPLWSISQVCDGDLEALFTKSHAVIRDPRRGGRVLARAERQGGLYRSKMRVRNPKYRGVRSGTKPSPTKGFGRQGTKK